MPVPFADLQLQYQTIKSEIDGAIASVIRDNAFIRGSYVDAFEREFAAAVDVRHCVSCANGTDALYLAMAALKVKPGDEVITTAHSWISTSAMITHAGATVVFCDTDGSTFTIDPAAIEAAITPRTVGIIPVHLYGQPADMDAIMAIANKHKLWVIEDCAQAHLARYKGQQVGTFGTAATYSFYPGKNLGAMGDAGAVMTNDERLAEHMTMLARHGGVVKHQHHIEGHQQPARRHAGRDPVGETAASPSVDESAAGRGQDLRRRPQPDRGRLGAGGRAGPQPCLSSLHDQASAPRRALGAPERQRRADGDQLSDGTAVPCRIPAVWPSPEQFPNAHRDQGRILSLPMFAEITPAQQDEVIDLIRKF
jgi:dTDP-4-amino-4,6-dideoxygalactose transaminase